MTIASSRQHLLLPWTVQEREDPVLEFDHGEGVYFFDRQGRRYLDFLSQLFNCNLGHGNRRVIRVQQFFAPRTRGISKSLAQSLSQQGGEGVRVFATYHVSGVFSGRRVSYWLTSPQNTPVQFFLETAISESRRLENLPIDVCA